MLNRSSLTTMTKKFFNPASAAVLMTLLTSHSAFAENFTASNAAQLLAHLQTAADNGNNKDTITISGRIETSQQFDIHSPVTIQGAPGFRVSHIVRTSTDGFQPLFNIQSSNVTIQNLLMFDRNGQNTNTQVAADAGNDHSNARLINIPYEDANRQISDITITNNTFENTPVGVASSGLIPRNLTVTNNDFNRVNRSVELLRDVGRVHNVWNVSADDVVLNGGTINISNNRVNGNRVRLGFSVDAGNDGVHVPPSFENIPFFDANARAFFSDRPVVFSNGSTINANSIAGANEFGIALATVANITVAGNWVATAEDNIWSDDPSIENNFTAGINVEHNSANIVVDSNTIVVGTTGGFATGINVLGFQDHEAPLNHAQASSNISIVRNTFEGTGQNVILAFGYENLLVQDNDASAFTTRNPFSVNASFYTIPCGTGTSTASGNTNIFYNQSSFDGNGDAPQFYDAHGNVIASAVCN